MGHIILYFFAGIIIVCIVISMWNDRQESKRIQEEAEQRKAMANQNASNVQVQNLPRNTKDLFLDTLSKIGCQYQIVEGNDYRILFAYQGEHLYADATNDNLYVHLWDGYWEQVDLDDIDDVCRLRKAINKANLNTMVTTVFTIDEEGKNMNVHSKSTIPFISTLPNLEYYLKVELDEFFRAHQIVRTEMHILREKENNA